MRRFFIQLVQAMLAAALYTSPIIWYFWSLKP